MTRPTRNGKAPRPSRRTGRPLGRPSALTPEVHKAIVSALAKGAFLHVAAEAAGVARLTVIEWIARGEGRHGARSTAPIYADFANDVRKARARARSDAEARVHRDTPLAWLRFGPGRERPDEPGWTAPTPSPEVLAAISEEEKRVRSLPLVEQLRVVTESLDAQFGADESTPE